MKNYKNLVNRENEIELVKSVYTLSKEFSSEEKPGMISQATRADVTSAKIAEGSSRNSEKDRTRFMQIALDSAFEVQTHLFIAKEMQWASNEKIEAVELLIEEEVEMMHSFIKRLKGDS